MAIEIIDQNMPCEVYFSAYTAGKEELMIEISKKYKTRVWVDENRFKDMKSLNLSKYFTLDESECWIFLNRLNDIDEEVNAKYIQSRKKKCIKIRPSGWCNSSDVITLKEYEYYLPYSSHSNYFELQKFVASIRPALLRCVVNSNTDSIDQIGEIKYYHQYSWVLKKLKQRGPDIFREKYVDWNTRSEKYKKCNGVDQRRRISEALALQLTEAEIKKDDVRGLSSDVFVKTGLEEAIREELFDLGPIPKKLPPPKKEKGKPQKVDRVLKKLQKEEEAKKKALFGTRRVDENRLLKSLHSEDYKSRIEQSLGDLPPNIGAGIDAIMEANAARDRAKSSRRDSMSEGGESEDVDMEIYKPSERKD